MKKTRGDDFELIFVSLDKSESEYKNYIKDMPWFCVPFDTPESDKNYLAKKYEADGIPHLVVLDDKGEVITMDGTSEVRDDPSGEKYPWKRKTFSEIWPKEVLSKSGKISSSSFDDKYLMLYFSAHWCPPCRGFTPKLSEAYTKMKVEHDNFELIFVSSDQDEKSFQEYFNEMTFWALPYEERDAKASLSKMFKIRGIPSLLMLGPVPKEGGDRPIVNSKVRPFIESGDFSDFPFHPKPYSDISVDPGDINEKKSIIVFNEFGDDEEQAGTINTVKDAAEQMGKENDVSFFYACKSEGVVPRLRDLLGITDRTNDTVLAMTDLDDDGAYYLSDETDVTVEVIKNFISNPGKRMQFS